ncbi:MAG: hypothetical protein ACT4P2_07660 [Pseudomonadota bacterium]
MSRRLYLLAGIAAVLAIVVAFGHDLPWYRSLPLDRGLAPEQMLRRIDMLNRFEQARSQIERAYVEVAVAYAERMAGLSTLATTRVDDRAFLEGLIRDRLTETGPFENLRIGFGAAQSLEHGVRRQVVDLSFTTKSDRQALFALAALGLPERGMAWEAFTVSADRDKQQLAVAGRLSALVIEPAE